MMPNDYDVGSFREVARCHSFTNAAETDKRLAR